MSFYFLDIRMLAFKKQFLYKYMEEKTHPTAPTPAQAAPAPEAGDAWAPRGFAILTAPVHVATIL